MKKDGMSRLELSYELRRVQALVVAGDGEVDMGFQGFFGQCRFAHGSDGVATGDGISSCNGCFFGQAGIGGDIAAGVPDHHSGSQEVIAVHGVNGTVCGGFDRCPGSCRQVHAVVHPPVPCGFIVGQPVHGVGCCGLPFHRPHGLGWLGAGGFRGGGGCGFPGFCRLLSGVVPMAGTSSSPAPSGPAGLVVLGAVSDGVVTLAARLSGVLLWVDW